MKDEIKFMFENYLNFANCSIQTFDDAKTGNQSLARIMSANNPDTWKQCDDLSSRGAGIFFSVNSMQEGKRGLEYVEEVNSWICEIDGLDKDLQQKLIKFCPLKPSMIIESKSSYHLYWFSIDGKKENWNTVCNGLRNYFDGDKAVVEISRVLRLPGYNHQKNKDDKFMIKVIHHEPKLYKEQEILEAYPDHRPRTEIKQEATTKETNIKKEIADDNFWERVKNMDSKRVLEVISGDRIVNGDTYSFYKNSGGTEQIFVNGKSTGCWIDTNGKIGSSSGGGPNWTNWVFRYSNVSGSELYSWIKDNFPEMIEKKDKIKQEPVKQVEALVSESVDEGFKHITYKEKLQRSVDEIFNTDPNKILKRGWEEWDNSLGGIYGGKIYLVGADTGVGKTTFVNQVANQIVSTGERVVRYSLEDRLEDIGKEELFYMCNRLRRQDGKDFYSWINFVNHEYNDAEFRLYVNRAFKELSEKDIVELDKTKPVNLENLIRLMGEESRKGTKVFFIDHLHYFEWDTRQTQTRLDLQIQNAMHSINEVARKYNVAIFLIAHYRQISKSEKEGTPSYNRFKDGSSIKQVANIIIQIERNINDEHDNTSTFHITKLRSPLKVKSLEAQFNLDTFEYTFNKTEKQKSKEKNYLDKLRNFKS